ncbi:equilibrative nucleotide transporter [Acrasis kona]|uniref:Equilibrative nucleotide transporter n=1 Tax=Acrasis kona TaxID=1008807 RepID=A0AAW2YGL8_9EUKA
MADVDNYDQYNKNQAGVTKIAGGSPELSHQNTIKKDEKPVPLYAYFAFYILGVGSVMSLFVFILSIDYYKKVFDQENKKYIPSIFNLVFNLGSVFTSTFVAIPIQSYVRSHRIMFSLFTLNLIVLLCTVAVNYSSSLPSVYEKDSPTQSGVFSVVCIFVAVLGFSCGINTACVFSVVNPIGPKYTSAVMGGIGSAGFLVAVFRMISLAVQTAVPKTITNQMIIVNVYFGIAALIQLICIIVSGLLIKMSFTIVSIPRRNKDVEMPKVMDPQDFLERSNESMVVTTPQPKVQESVLDRIKDYLKTVWIAIAPGSNVYITFVITYSLYPTILALYVSTMNQYFQESGFFVATVLACYSLGDFLGRVLSVFKKVHFIPVNWMWLVVYARVLFYVLLILYLRYNLTIYDPLKITGGFFMSLTGGYIGSVSMMQGAQRVKGKRYAGGAMTLFLNGGIASGAVLGVAIGFAVAKMPQS